MGYIDTEAKRERIQQALADAKDPSGDPYYSGTIDGVLGAKSITAITEFRKDRNIVYPPHPATVDTDLMRELGLLTIQDPAVQAAGKLVLPQLFNNISAILAVISALKGKTMTTDQIGGLVRAILTFLAGLAVAKGWVDNATALTIVGGLVTIATAAWSIFTNRPSKIASN